jgi:ribosomal protein L31
MNKVCDCGNDKFHIGNSNNKDCIIYMCSKCHSVYDNKGKKIIVESIINKGTIVHINGINKN